MSSRPVREQQLDNLETPVVGRIVEGIATVERRTRLRIGAGFQQEFDGARVPTDGREDQRRAA